MSVYSEEQKRSIQKTKEAVRGISRSNSVQRIRR